MRAIAWAAFLVGCGAPHAPPTVPSPAPAPIASAPLVLMPPKSDLVCHDTRDGNGAIASSHCLVTRLVEADVPELLARMSYHLAVEIRATATQSDFDAIAGAPFLRSVTVYAPLVTRLDALAELRDLEVVGIHVHAMSSLPALAGLRLRALTISGPGRLDNLVPVAAVKSLEILSISGGPDLTLAHLDGIERLPALTTFATYALIEDGSALASTHIKTLSLMNGTMPFASIRDLALDNLSLGMNRPTAADVAALEAMPLLRTLKSLDLWIDRVPAFAAMPALESLRLNIFTSDGVWRLDADISVVKLAPALTSFSISGMRTLDITPLLSLRKLEAVSLGACRADLRRLDELPKLHIVSFPKRIELRPKRRDFYLAESETGFACPAD